MSKPKGIGRYERLDLTGKRYGRLVVIEFVGTLPNDKSISLWKCKCDCGNEKIIKTGSLQSGTTKSCGCLRLDKIRTHNKSNTRIYRIWQGIKRRCNNTNCNAYKIYGARGIKICDEWSNINGFDNFYNWSMDNGYSDALTIDRIDVNGNYEPDNCRWATMEEQGNNRRDTKKYVIDGESHTITEWSKISGISKVNIRWRIKSGWDIKKAVFKPLETKEEKVSHFK